MTIAYIHNLEALDHRYDVLYSNPEFMKILINNKIYAKKNIFCPTCVSSHSFREKFCRVLTVASFMLIKAYLMPMHCLGSFSKDRNM